MTVAARDINPDVWTKEQFLAWAETRAGDRGYEFDGVRPVAMAPATLGHNEIARDIREKIRSKLPAGIGCKTYSPQQPIETVGGALREPDAFIACSAQRRTSVTISTPVIVFEVLSSGKENRQRYEVDKVDEYESVPTILRYVIIETESRGIRVFWVNPESASGAGNLQMPRDRSVCLSSASLWASTMFMMTSSSTDGAP